MSADRPPQNDDDSSLLRPEQFEDLARQLHTPGAGWSVHLGSGDHPQSGIMVSRKGTEKAIVPPESVRPTHLSDFASENREGLTSRNRFMGGWHDPERHEVDIDVTQRYPSTQRDHVTRQMFRQDQFAAYDVGDDRTIQNYHKVKFMGHEPDEELAGQVQDALKPGRAPAPDFVTRHVRRTRRRDRGR